MGGGFVRVEVGVVATPPFIAVAPSWVEKQCKEWLKTRSRPKDCLERQDKVKNA